MQTLPTYTQLKDLVWVGPLCTRMGTTQATWPLSNSLFTCSDTGPSEAWQQQQQQQRRPQQEQQQKQKQYKTSTNTANTATTLGFSGPGPRRLRPHRRAETGLQRAAGEGPGGRIAYMLVYHIYVD